MTVRNVPKVFWILPLISWVQPRVKTILTVSNFIFSFLVTALMNTVSETQRQIPLVLE